MTNEPSAAGYGIAALTIMFGVLDRLHAAQAISSDARHEIMDAALDEVSAPEFVDAQQLLRLQLSYWQGGIG
jgi:hypothetical protein